MNSTSKAACVLVCLLALTGCGEDESEPIHRTHQELSRAKTELAHRESELRRSQERLSAAEARTEKLEAELSRTRRRAERAEAKTQHAESDFLGASAIAFACVVTVLLLAHMLVGERRSRKALAALLKWIKRRAT